MATPTVSLLKSKWLRAGIAVIGLALFLIGVRGIWRRNEKALDVPPPINTMADVERARAARLALDHQILKNRTAQSTDIFGALVRLGQQQDLDARIVCLQLAGSPDSMIREGVANCLGNFDDEVSLSKLEPLLRDQERRVVVQAVEALGHRPGAARVRILTAFAQEHKGDSEMRLHIAHASYQASESNEARANALGDLLALVESRTTDTHAHGTGASQLDIARAAFLDATALAPRDPRVVKLLRSRVESEKDPVLVSNFIRHLGTIGDPWLRENIDSLDRSKSPLVRVALIGVIHSICPKNRFDFLGKIASSEQENLEVRTSAVRELSYLPSDDSRRILTQISRTTQGPATSAVAKIAQEALASLDKSGLQDPCPR